MRISVLGLCGRSVFLKTDHFHSPGETIQARSMYSEPGGKGCNQAVSAARLGAQVSFICCLGKDQDGSACLDFLRREGVKTAAMLTDSEPSAYASIITAADGESRITVYPGASRLLSPEFVYENEKLISESDMLLLNNEYPSCCNTAAVEIAKKYSVPVIINPAPAYRMAPELLKAGLLTPNLSEASQIFAEKELSPAELPALFKRNGISTAVVTLGSEGAMLIDNGHTLMYPALKSRPADTTGAGDTFNAALAVALLRKMSLREAVVFASNAAALSIRKNYVMPGLPRMEDIKNNYQELIPIEKE